MTPPAPVPEVPAPARTPDQARHLVRRFVRALPRREPPAADDAAARAALTAGERELWARLAAHDRRHAIEVAADVDRRLAGSPHAGDPRWREAALLHDVGKEASGFGVVGRAAATVVAAGAGPARLARWARRPRGLRRRVADYAAHGAIGAAMIRSAGGSEAAAGWAAAHHAPRAAWAGLGVPPDVLDALDAADRA